MSQDTNTSVPADAPAQHVIPADIRSEAIRAMVKASRDHDRGHARVDRSLLESLIEAARELECHVTEDVWTVQLAKPARKAMKAKLAPASLASAMTRAKKVTLAASARPLNWAAIVDAARAVGEPLPVFWGDPLAGEGINAYVARVTPLLDAAKLPDGSWIMKHDADGNLAARTGPKAKTEDAPAGDAPADAPAGDTPPADAPAGSAGNVAKGGQEASAELAAARILFPGNPELAARLELVASNYREAFAKWSADILAEHKGAQDVLGTKSRNVRKVTLKTDAPAA